MATEPGWFYEWFANNWFPPVWFAPSDDEDVPLAERRPTGGGTDSHVPRVNLLELHRITKERNEELARLEAERIARDELQAAEIVFRLRRDDPVSPEQIGETQPAEDSTADTQPEPRKPDVSFAPVNDLVATFAAPLATFGESVATLDDASPYVREFSDDDALALIMILAEID